MDIPTSAMLVRLTFPDSEGEPKTYPFLTDKGIELIKRYTPPRVYVGVNTFASYKDYGDSNWKIGYGSYVIKGRPVGAKDKLTRKEIENQLAEDLKEFSEYVEKYVFVRVNKNRRAALLSFAHSIGIQSFKNCRLLDLINNLAPKKEIIKEWSPFINTLWRSGGEELIDRRRTELNLYFSPDTEMVAAAYHKCECKHCLLNLGETWNGSAQQVKAIEYLERKMTQFDPTGETLRRFFRYWSQPPRVFGSDKLNNVVES
jgi:GH24 family phage-related lysozyme (muramidase)